MTTCSSSSGNTYDVTCGIKYEGSVIDTSGVNGSRRKRAVEPTYQACQNLCDSYSQCVAFNYAGTDCELLSSVTGTTSAPGSVAGTPQRQPPSDDPVCPGSAGQTYTDSAGESYAIGCYTSYAGNEIGNPISETSFGECLPYCDSMSGCAGVEFNTYYNLCYLKSSFHGSQASNTSLIYGMRDVSAGGYGGSGGTATVTPTTTIGELIHGAKVS